jgi:hypothetical protein
MDWSYFVEQKDNIYEIVSAESSRITMVPKFRATEQRISFSIKTTIEPIHIPPHPPIDWLRQCSALR